MIDRCKGCKYEKKYCFRDKPGRRCSRYVPKGNTKSSNPADLGDNWLQGLKGTKKKK